MIERRMTLSACCWMYWQEGGRVIPQGRNCAFVDSPLGVDAPADARPSWSGGEIRFYDASGNNFLGLARCVHHVLENYPPTLLFLSKQAAWFEVHGGQVMYLDGEWIVRWNTSRNTRLACMANFGMAAYREPNVTIPWWRRWPGLWHVQHAFAQWKYHRVTGGRMWSRRPKIEQAPQ